MNTETTFDDAYDESNRFYDVERPAGLTVEQAKRLVRRSWWSRLLDWYRLRLWR